MLDSEAQAFQSFCLGFEGWEGNVKTQPQFEVNGGSGGYQTENPSDMAAYAHKLLKSFPDEKYGRVLLLGFPHAAVWFHINDTLEGVVLLPSTLKIYWIKKIDG